MVGWLSALPLLPPSPYPGPPPPTPATIFLTLSKTPVTTGISPPPVCHFRHCRHLRFSKYNDSAAPLLLHLWSSLPRANHCCLHFHNICIRSPPPPPPRTVPHRGSSHPNIFTPYPTPLIPIPILSSSSITLQYNHKWGGGYPNILS